ncbi:MAG: efflux RND transporter periplasmic adaptor subunit, partial [Acidobacteria bacterium]|nr:efflux RND transporter periplasmic adaptor subunit [Acidobacteriota bacterium]
FGIMEHTKSRRSALLVTGLVGVTLAMSCGRSLQGEDASASAASRSVVQRADFDHQLLLTGQLEAVRSIEIKSPQTSLFQMRIQFMAEEGTLVQEGDPILDFDNSALADQVLELENKILDAEIQIVAQRNEIESTLKDLEIQQAEKSYAYDVAKLKADIDQEIVSRREYGERQLAYETAAREREETTSRISATRERGDAELDVLAIQRDKLQQDLWSAQAGLELLSIKASAAGLVTYERRPRSTARWQEGDSCWPGQTVMRLPDLSVMQVVFLVNEVDARLLTQGMAVELVMDSFPGRRLEGTIREIPSMAVTRSEDSQVRVFKVVSSLSETWPEAMKPGMSVRGRVVVERRRSVPLVPRSWVTWRGDEAWLAVPSEDGNAGGQMRIHPVSGNATEYVLDAERDAQVVTRFGLGGVSAGATS